MKRWNSKRMPALDIHVNHQATQYSYARYSSLQRSVIAKVMPMVEETLKALYSKSFPEKFVVADLGCSSGPNALLAISIIINAILTFCKDNDHSPPELQVFLNDLPSNDFNHVFRSLPQFYQTLNKVTGSDSEFCFISAMPGSFYGRLFPSRSLSFVHSSSSLHWLSQVPEGIGHNKGNIYMSKTSPKSACEAYLEQFQRDFSLFLSCRAEELQPKGQMVLTFLGRSTADPTASDSIQLWNLLSKSLVEMCTQGLVEEGGIDTFNLPWYTPYCKEVSDIIEKEGCFEITWMRSLKMNWDPSGNDENQTYIFDEIQSGKNVANGVRAALESILTNHFGMDIIDELFLRYAKHVGAYLSLEMPKHYFLVVSLTKKM